MPNSVPPICIVPPSSAAIMNWIVLLAGTVVDVSCSVVEVSGSEVVVVVAGSGSVVVVVEVVVV